MENNKKKKISIIGSTGSIGTQALEVIEKLQDKFEIIALAGGHNVELLKKQAEKFKPKYICHNAQTDNCEGNSYKILHGSEGLEEICSNKENDIILVACSGKIGLKPTLTAIRNGIDIALANKETLVMAGDIVMAEAKKYGDVVEAASSADKTFTYIPKTKPEDFRDDADYVYICMNNTIYGTVYKELPPVGDKVLIADVSSCALSEPLDISKFGMVYFGAQKNVAPAGLVVAIIREDLLGNARDITPVMMNYKVQADADSLYNTPPCWTIYICKLVLEWIKNDIGGLEKMKERNEKKASILYNFLDNSKLFKGTVVPEDRSLMNVPFVIGDDELEKKFIAEAEANGFVNLKGHRTVGGMRASIYNAMPIEGVEKLVEFMAKFEEENK